MPSSMYPCTRLRSGGQSKVCGCAKKKVSYYVPCAPLHLGQRILTDPRLRYYDRLANTPGPIALGAPMEQWPTAAISAVVQVAIRSTSTTRL